MGRVTNGEGWLDYSSIAGSTRAPLGSWTLTMRFGIGGSQTRRESLDFRAKAQSIGPKLDRIVSFRNIRRRIHWKRYIHLYS